MLQDMTAKAMKLADLERKSHLDKGLLSSKSEELTAANTRLLQAQEEAESAKQVAESARQEVLQLQRALGQATAKADTLASSEELLLGQIDDCLHYKQAAAKAEQYKAQIGILEGMIDTTR